MMNRHAVVIISTMFETLNLLVVPGSVPAVDPGRLYAFMLSVCQSQESLIQQT